MGLLLVSICTWGVHFQYTSKIRCHQSSSPSGVQGVYTRVSHQNKVFEGTLPDLLKLEVWIQFFLFPLVHPSIHLLYTCQNVY